VAGQGAVGSSGTAFDVALGIVAPDGRQAMIEHAAQFKQAGVRDLTFDNLVALQIHGANPDNVKQIGTLGYPNLTADEVVAARTAGLNLSHFIASGRR